MNEPVLLKVREAAERLQLSTRTVYGLVRSGRIRAVKPTSDWRIPVDALDEFIASLPDNQQGAA